jgi:hypothetical protein
MTTFTLRPTLIARLFADGAGKLPLAEIGPGALTVHGKAGAQRLVYGQIDEVRVEYGWFWAALIIQPKAGPPLSGADRLYS